MIQYEKGLPMRQPFLDYLYDIDVLVRGQIQIYIVDLDRGSGQMVFVDIYDLPLAVI